MNDNISSKPGSKEKVVRYAHQVASVTAGATQRSTVASGLSVDQLMQAAFYNGRTPRSAEYKAGTRMALEHRIERIDIVPPYEAGTAAADAFFAGLDEGKCVWRAAVAKIGGAA
jgi:hypothetical protein